MKIKNPKITILINAEYTEIEILDSDANTYLAKVKLTPEQLSKVLGRQGHIECQCTTGDLTRIGKKHESENFEFEITKGRSDVELYADCSKALIEHGMQEWAPDNYYSSQNSFFKKDGKDYARVVIRRWV